MNATAAGRSSHGPAGDWEQDTAPPAVDVSVAHPARRYDFWLGGKDNFAADRLSAQRIAAAHPNVRTGVLENRAFLGRAVRYLAADAGIRQFLDIGTGLPAANNVHEVAQGIAPHSRVVYVDNDPIVLVHARALLTSTPPGRTAYIDADLRDPASILASPDLHAVLDLRQPVALLLVAVLHFLTDADQPQQVVQTLLSALPPGSFLVLSHATTDFMTEQQRAGLAALSKGDSVPFCARPGEQIDRFTTGLEPVEPGLVSVAHWRADGLPPPRPSDAEVACYGVVARKPALEAGGAGAGAAATTLPLNMSGTVGGLRAHATAASTAATVVGDGRPVQP
ncbi:SAM-dependent methyltransferase [Dactylosporangium sp. NBC_01737]|uniref:SAM-dependent methyltransferase n=1 Tax=Dactylosporangium sp. NBC_01737 TaxID=2975959 RepID=UPI002E1119C9